MTDTIYPNQSDGTKIKVGQSLVANGGTITTGIRTSWFKGKCRSADTVVAATISGQTITISLVAAGSAATGNHYVDWKAIDNNKT